MKQKIRNSYLVTYTVLRVLVVTLILGLFFWYVLFQSRLLITGPSITLANEPTVQQSSRVVSIEGTAKNIVSISLNGRQIFVDQDGTFSESLVLLDGYSTMTLLAQDRYGRTTTISRDFVLTEPSEYAALDVSET